MLEPQAFSSCMDGSLFLLMLNSMVMPSQTVPSLDYFFINGLFFYNQQRVKIGYPAIVCARPLTNTT